MDGEAHESAGGWLSSIRTARQSGDYLQAFDLARQAIAQHPGEGLFRYEAALALARSRAGSSAEALLAELPADLASEFETTSRVQCEFAALRARLLKDKALRAAPAGRAQAAGAAAVAYERAFQAGGGYYPAVNAASLWLLADHAAESARWARLALEAARISPDRYWAKATVGEALFLLDERMPAEAALREAAAEGAGRHDDLAATRRQLRWIADLKHGGHELAGTLPVPRIVFWPGGAPPGAPLDRALASAGPGPTIAFAAVVAGGDLQVAAALAAAGAEVNLWFPCSTEQCLAALERGPGGDPDTAGRCVQQSRTVSTVTDQGMPDEEVLWRLASQQAAGTALLRGQALDSPVYRLGAGADGGGVDDRLPQLDPEEFRAAPLAERAGSGGRITRAILFGDVRGFSKLRESQMPAFLDRVIGGIADVLEGFGEGVQYAETAGDGLYLVVSDVATAARCSLAIQQLMTPGRFAGDGLPAELAIRLSGHFGPVSRGYDRIIKRHKFFGSEVIRTARIEPVTPPGHVYVTEQFAATLSCTAPRDYTCEYVGNQPMAKNYGTCRMYALRPG